MGAELTGDLEQSPDLKPAVSTQAITSQPARLATEENACLPLSVTTAAAGPEPPFVLDATKDGFEANRLIRQSAAIVSFSEGRYF